MVRVPLEPEVYDLIFTEGEPDGLWPVTPDPRQHTRRSLYLFAKRNVRQPLLEAFDQPDTLTSCPVRPVSTFAPQALILLNGPLPAGTEPGVRGPAAARSGLDDTARVERAYRLALSRPPDAEEKRVALTFLPDKPTSCVTASTPGCRSACRTTSPKTSIRPPRPLWPTFAWPCSTAMSSLMCRESLRGSVCSGAKIAYHEEKPSGEGAGA